MSVIDILTRVDGICKKYEKYDLEKQKELQISGNDSFLKLYAAFAAEVDACAQKADDASIEKNRAVVATLNAEIRRAKVELRNELPKLEKLAHRKVKGLTKDELAARPDLVLALSAKIEAIPDGATMGAKKAGAWGGTATGNRMEIKIDSVNPDDIMRPEQYEHTEESKGFRQEYEMRKAKQDQGLETISEGLMTLKNMAEDINEELDRQVPLMDEIDTKVEKATSELRNTNVRLKDTVTKLRSSRNFCIDIILLCVILGIAAYLYNVLKK
eukprot:c20233_g1_i1 orf=404-1216(-)